MIIKDLKDFHRGWFIGNFEPSVFNTEFFEVGLLHHKQDEQWPTHYHKIGTEYNVLISGKLLINDCPILEGEIFIIEPNEVSEPEFLTDCTILCVKTPSITTDKYEV